MNRKKNFSAVEIGRMYERRDGQKAITFHYDCVSNRYNCVVLGTLSFFSVNEDGQYLENKDDHNDLVFDYKMPN